MEASKVKRPGTVLFVHAGDRWLAGSERSLLSVVDGLQPRGFRFCVLCTSPVLADACCRRGVPAALYRTGLFLLPADRPRLNPLPLLRTVSAIRRFARQQKAELIHANNVLPAQAGLVAARSLGVPIVAHVRTDRCFRAARYASGARWCDAVVCISHAVARNYWPEKLGDRLRVIYNGVDVEAFAAADGSGFRRRVSPDGLPLIGTAAFLRPEKGVGDFLRVAAAARQADVPCRFVVAGEGPERPALAALARRLGVDRDVSFLGYVSDMPAFMRSLDVFLFTSRAEAFGRAIVEAAAAGRPAVAAAVGGVPEIVRDGQTGFLAPAGDVATLWAKVRRLVDDAALRERLGQAARHDAARRFSVSTYVDQIAGLYESLL